MFAKSRLQNLIQPMLSKLSLSEYSINKVSYPLRAIPIASTSKSSVPNHRKTLRIIQLVDPMEPRSSAGRMVMSGSIEAICAELDRLAMLENHQHRH